MRPPPPRSTLFPYTTLFRSAADDAAALRAFQTLCEDEGIIPALESAHAVAHVLALGERGALRPDDVVVINLSGRGDKDINRSEEHTSELQSRRDLVCRLLLE